MNTKIFARTLILSGLVLLMALFAWEAFAEELSIVEVRSNIPLAEKDPVYRDFYINSGSNEGLKRNLVVTATRKITVRDATGTQTYGDMMAPVGQLKIIFVGEKFAVARELKLISRDDQPMLEQTGIMIGDKIELKGSFVDNRKIPSQKTAEKAPVKPEPTATVKQESKPVTEGPAPAAVNAATPAPSTEVKPLEDSSSQEKSATTPEGEVDKTASADDSTI